MTPNSTRVLIVDDSAVIRGLITKSLEKEPDIVVAGTAMNGERALSWMESNPVDVVILDVEMPVMDGLTALQKIQQDFPEVPVIMASGLTSKGAETTVKALSLGAVGCVAKPQTGSAAESIRVLSRELVMMIKAVCSKKTGTSPLSDKKVQNQTNNQLKPSRLAPSGKALYSKNIKFFKQPEVLVIGTSTGGPKALAELLPKIPVDFPMPILIVQHMPAGFTEILASHIQKDSGRKTVEAKHNQPLESHMTYVAPGGSHLLIGEKNGQKVTLINQDPPEHFCRPSVNPLFRSAAAHFGNSTLAVMLTGMGEDGIEGSHEIAQVGGTIFAQDEATSVVWGMPAAVVAAGLADKVLPLSKIAAEIKSQCLVRT
ncbi:MAG: chemotaxis response regulator protein-glutamate methylesterase [Planctomycetes bacterium]|nr:chemotaxis response regulator protein-glutamate methylesterase [Planctomycetota bacterium]MCH9725586.1 chemotaxis response regulator protein-glutamate methylesterase [Planctomycetota bacterium]MCH9777640.1 chemotaxis response regulator protein-glutamate methylesterase [Planctomycetota bacterium]MDF1743397.1 chemotaxis response regulator protein-glutamate methylesterase [Gimesia sp.]